MTSQVHACVLFTSGHARARFLDWLYSSVNAFRKFMDADTAGQRFSSFNACGIALFLVVWRRRYGAKCPHRLSTKDISRKGLPHLMRFLIPESIASPRLLLRTFKHEDWHAMHEHYSDETCTQYTFRRALTEGESWRAMATMAGQWQLKGYGPYALEEKATGAVLGAAGLWYPNDWPELEIKWALVRRYWGKGYAREAACAVQAMAARHMPAASLISFIHADNVRSINLALSVGATLEKEVEFRAGNWQVYRHPAKAAADA